MELEKIPAEFLKNLQRAKGRISYNSLLSSYQIFLSSLKIGDCDQMAFFSKPIRKISFPEFFQSN